MGKVQEKMDRLSQLEGKVRYLEKLYSGLVYTLQEEIKRLDHKIETHVDLLDERLEKEIDRRWLKHGNSTLE